VFACVLGGGGGNYLELYIMYQIQKPSDSEYYKPSSEPFRIFSNEPPGAIKCNCTIGGLLRRAELHGVSWL
jgi:hypothetical protein